MYICSRKEYENTPQNIKEFLLLDIIINGKRFNITFCKECRAVYWDYYEKDSEKLDEYEICPDCKNKEI